MCIDKSWNVIGKFRNSPIQVRFAAVCSQQALQIDSFFPLFFRRTHMKDSHVVKYITYPDVVSMWDVGWQTGDSFRCLLVSP